MDLEVVASGSCGGYRPLKRAPMAGTASIHLQTTLTGITYLVTVDVWDLDESVIHGPYDGHSIEIGGRVYATLDSHPAPLPDPVRRAFWSALGTVSAWMVQSGVSIDRVLTWGKIAGEQAEVQARAANRNKVRRAA